MSESQTVSFLSRRIADFYLQTQALSILPHEHFRGLTACLRAQIPSASVTILQSIKTGRHSFGGVCRCGNVWVCKPCASKVTEFRAREMREALKLAQDKGLQPSMWTFTLPHYSSDSCEKILSALGDAQRHFFNSRDVKRILVDIGYVGRVRSLEVTRGDNGWHCHIHAVIFSRYPGFSFLPYLLLQWSLSVRSAGLMSPINDHALVITTDPSDYPVKWGLSEELVKGHLKSSKKSTSFSPFALLAATVSDASLIAPYIEYALAFHGHKQLVWSRCLRSYLGLSVGKSDESIAQAEDEGGVILRYVLDNICWRMIRSADYRAEVLDIIDSQDMSSLHDLLSDVVRGRLYDYADYCSSL